MLTRGVQPRRSVVWRWSNQWAVLSCSARNLVIGGSPEPRCSVHTVSAIAPAHRAGVDGTEWRGGRTPAARQMAVSSSATGRGSPLDTTTAWPRASRQRSSAATSASTALVMYVVSMTLPPADHREPAGAGPGDDASDELGVARPPHQVRAHHDGRGPIGRGIGGERNALRHRFAARVVPSRTLCIRRACRGPDQRGTGVRNGRRGDVHKPLHPGATARFHDRLGSGDVGVGELAVPTADVHLRGQMHHRVVAAERRDDRVAVGDVGQHLPVANPGRAALQHGNGVAPLREPVGDACTEQARAPRHQDPHGRLPVRPPAEHPLRPLRHP